MIFPYPSSYSRFSPIKYHFSIATIITLFLKTPSTIHTATILANEMNNPETFNSVFNSNDESKPQDPLNPDKFSQEDIEQLQAVAFYVGLPILVFGLFRYARRCGWFAFVGDDDSDDTYGNDTKNVAQKLPGPA